MADDNGRRIAPARHKDHPEILSGKVGVLLINLGTPDGTDYWSMRRYLAEFLSDRRVVDLSRWIWYPLLYGVILNRRPQRVGKAYRSIWNTERDESFLRTYTRSQAEKLGARLVGLGKREVVVDWAMRYGRPSINERIAALKEAGCDRILWFALYPQYSASTTGSVNDKVFEAVAAMRWQPALRSVPPYYDESGYIDALADSLRADISHKGFEPQVVLASFHGLPQRYFESGDPYYCHCQKTTRLLREKLGYSKKQLELTFQSRFGREEWLKPYTDERIRELACSGVKRLTVITPGFVSDCLETLEEIEDRAGALFRSNGGEKFSLVPCLNDGPAGMAVITRLVVNELQGWV